MTAAADGTAVPTTLWRAMHVQVDAPPHVIVDHIGLRLANPPDDWLTRGDMHPDGTRPFRASMVARAADPDVLTERYFADRTDGLRPPRNAEELLVAST